MIKILFMARDSQKDGYEAIRRQIKAFPTGPGLYFMKGAKDNVLYIGKAKNLRSRVSSYFQPSGDLVVSRGPKITEMLSKVKKVDFLEARNEVDAVLTEARLIKDIRPPYNTDLVDDKTFPYSKAAGERRQIVRSIRQCKGFEGGSGGFAKNLPISHLQS